jgi:hypothetical protein
MKSKTFYHEHWTIQDCDAEVVFVWNFKTNANVGKIEYKFCYWNGNTYASKENTYY